MRLRNNLFEVQVVAYGLILSFGATAVIAGTSQPLSIRSFPVETTPPHLPSYHPDRTKYVIDNPKLWVPGSTLKVAFNGGTDEERQQVATVAEEWTKYGNVKFDFGNCDNEWSDSDAIYRANIRISFGSGGFWCAVGRDSMEKGLFPPNRASMNLDLDICPDDQIEMSIRHEFGHALGFQHEHQRPDGECASEFRWEDDEGYVDTFDASGMYVADKSGRMPGIYKWCSGPPTRLSEQWLDENLRSLPESSAFILGPKDKASIMHYHFPDFFFKRGKQSPCFTSSDGHLSSHDKDGMRKAYPWKKR